MRRNAVSERCVQKFANLNPCLKMESSDLVDLSLDEIIKIKKKDNTKRVLRGRGGQRGGARGGRGGSGRGGTGRGGTGRGGRGTVGVSPLRRSNPTVFRGRGGALRGRGGRGGRIDKSKTITITKKDFAKKALELAKQLIAAKRNKPTQVNSNRGRINRYGASNMRSDQIQRQRQQQQRGWRKTTESRATNDGIMTISFNAGNKSNDVQLKNNRQRIEAPPNSSDNLNRPRFRGRGRFNNRRQQEYIPYNRSDFSKGHTRLSLTERFSASGNRGSRSRGQGRGRGRGRGRGQGRGGYQRGRQVFF